MIKETILCSIVLSLLIAGFSVNTKENRPLENQEPKQIKKLPVTIDPSVRIELPVEKKEQLKPVSGLFQTSLETWKEDGKIKLNFSLANISGEDQQIVIGSGHKYDVFVYNEHHELVYDWTINKAFTAAATVMNLKPEGKLTFNEEWNLKNNKNIPVPPGSYTIEVRVLINMMKTGTVSPDDLTAKSFIEI